MRSAIGFRAPIRWSSHTEQAVGYLSTSGQSFICHPDGFVLVDRITNEPVRMQSVHDFEVEPFPCIACIGAVGCQQRKYGIFNQLSSYSMSLPTHATLTGNRVLRCWRAIYGGRARISQPAQRSHQPIRSSTGKTYSVTTRIKRTWATHE